MTVKENLHDDWKKLVAAGQAFREMAPWAWLGDGLLLGVEDPVTGELCFGSVMGGGGEEFGLLAFRGAVGLWGFLQFGEMDRLSPWDREIVFNHLRALSFSLGARDEVPDSLRRLYRQLGYAFRGAQDWPVFSSYVPGFAAAPVQDDEIRLLAHCLELTTTFAHRLRTDEVLRREWEARTGLSQDPTLDTYEVLCLVPAMSVQHGETISINGHEYTFEWKHIHPENPVVIDGDFDVEDVKQVVQQMKVNDRVWEFDIWPAPMEIEGPDNRAAKVEIALCVDTDNRLIIGFELIGGGETPRPTDILLGIMKSAGYIPSKIKMARRDVWESLEAFSDELDITIEREDYLPYLQDAFLSMAEQMGG